MKSVILFAAIVVGFLTAPLGHSADSANTATAFAVNTPNRIDGNLFFYNRLPAGGMQNFLYRFTIEDELITKLTINGQVVVGSNDEPLREFPFPLLGTVESVSINVHAYDDELDWNGNVVSSKDAGSGGEFFPEVYKGWRLYVSLTPSGIEVFVPFDLPSGTSMAEWVIQYQGRSAGLTTTPDGKTGFLITFDVVYGNFWYSITRNGVETEIGELDPFDVLGNLPQGEQLTIRPVNGVDILDLRNKQWKIITCAMDGIVAAEHPDGLQSQGVTGDAVAVRTEEWGSVQLRYAGPAAWLHIIVVDSQGQPYKDAYGNLQEWQVSTEGIEWSGQAYLTTEALWLPTGRAVVTVTPADQNASWRPYKLLGIKRGGVGKG